MGRRDERGEMESTGEFAALLFFFYMNIKMKNFLMWEYTRNIIMMMMTVRMMAGCTSGEKLFAFLTALI